MIKDTTLRPALAQVLQDIQGAVHDAMEGTGMVLEAGELVQVTAEIVVTEGGLSLVSTRTDNLTQTTVPDTLVPIVATDTIGAGTDSSTETRTNSGGKRVETDDTTKADNKSDRATSTGGGDSVTQDREINAYGP